MILICNSSGEPCPHCGELLSVEATWECDGAPYPDQVVQCPACKKAIYVEQSIQTTLSRR